MFTWICPQCGREVSPSYDECPDCKARLAAAGTVPPQPPGTSQAPPSQQPPYPPPGYQPVPGSEYVAPQPPPQPQPPVYYQQPPQSPQPAQPYYQPQQTPPQGTAYYAPAPPQQPQQPPQYYQPPPQQPGTPQYYPPQAQPPARHALLNLPTWLMTIIFTVGIGGIIFGIYSLLQTGKTAGSGPTPATSVESPAAKPGAKTNPLQKQIEITGVRFSQDAKKKTMVTFVIVNHSAAEIGGLAGNVTIWGSTKKSEEDAQGTFTFTTDMAPYQSKEISAPLNSKLKIYELADWQNITTDVQITAPAG
jgi:hypothetical protein